MQHVKHWCHMVLLLLLLLSPALLMAQTAAKVTLSGQVSDSVHAPLAGVTIAVGNKAIGTSQPDGKFSVQVTKGAKVIFSSVGYQPHSHTAKANAASLKIVLQPTSNTLGEVVVTALGITRQEMALGYSATTVQGEQLTDARSANWTDALSGKVAGLNMVRSGSGPTATNKIILRGENNLTGDNEALIVVDGVVINQGSGRRTAIAGENVYGTGSDNMPVDYGSSLNDLNPDDIESVTVLKGPGAAALYGQRGANGAVIITTKSGSSKKKGLGVTVSSNISMEQVNRWPDLQYEYGQGLAGAAYYSYGTTADGASTSGTSSAYGPRFNGQQFYQFDPVTQKVGDERTPWVPYVDGVKKYFNTGKTITNTVSVDGGTDKTTARFSFTNVQNDWITPNTGYKRNTVALSVNSKVNEKLQISSKINYTNKWSDNLPGAGYGNQSIMYWWIFWQPSANPDWLRNYWVQGQEGKRIMFPFSSFPENPYAIANEFLNSSNRHNVTGNVQATYNFSKSLSLQLRTSMDLAYEERAQKRPYDAGSKLQKGSLRTQDVFSNEFSADFLLKYSRRFGRFDISAMGGGSLLRNRYIKNETRADSLIYPGVYSFANSAGPLLSMPYNSKYAINSFYGIFTASYNKIFFVDITGRQDWNSVLATPNRTTNAGFFYPSVNTSIVLSNLLRMPRKITYAKLRFSASSVGSGGTSPYLTAYNYESAGSFFAGGLQAPGLLANPNLRPLRTTSYELGGVVKMFENRLTVDLALYAGNTKDQHLRRILDRSSGFTQVLINAGRVANTGVELAVSATPLKSKKGLNWTSSVVFSSNKNEIKELLDSSVVLQTGPVGGGQIVAQVGGSMGDLWGRGYVRSPDGQVVYDATTGYAQLSQNLVYLGNTIPKYKIGWNNEFQYKQFRLNFLFDAQVGGVAHSLMHYKLAEQGKTTNTLPGRYSGIIGNGVVMTADGKYAPNTTIATNIDEYYRSHFGIDNAEGSTFSTDFIKFREARLDFTLPAKLIKKLGLQRANVGVYGRDLFIWSPWPMFDPEFGTLGGTDIVRGFETAQFPSTRTMGVNIVLGF
ncbi:SusC/RagA family TonB-linked outer membrane protein [Phnomibacter sp. MR]|uniref:SusC/RagA family TonB-linked outer membrane protein n=1 Tax=Phnomibacter sp. MR TaxID=3042318 RepID=UPI003A802FD3